MMVSICVITYNHEDFIQQSLQSLLDQKTSFPFEIIVGEDGSSDNTRQIILDLQQQHPDTIRLLPDMGNLGMMKNFVRTLKVAKGKYIALCEGDDYWTDSRKLQKQIDFLENNQEYVLCYTDIQHLYHEEKKLTDLIQKSNDTIYLKDLFTKNYVTTLTAVFRNGLLKIPEDFEKLKVGDWPLFVLLSQFGNIKRLPFISGVYRIHSTNYYHTNSYLDKKLKITEATEFLYGHLQSRYRSLVRKKLVDSYFILSILYLKSQNSTTAHIYYKKLKLLIRNGLHYKFFRLRLIFLLYKFRQAVNEI